MAIYRSVQMSFWTDGKIIDDFTPEDRYFYLYLFTNPHTNLCGCYEISKKQMALETGYSGETIDNLLDRFEKIHGVLEYSDKTKELLLLNWHKYNWINSPKVLKALESEASTIKCDRFKQYCIDTISIQYEYSMDIPVTVTVTDTVTDTDADSDYVTDTVKEKSRITVKDIKCIVDMYNKICISLPKCVKLTDTRKRKVKSRIREFGVESIEFAFVKCEESDFLSGRTGKWKASFDWLMENDSNITRVLEGNYDNKKSNDPF